MHLLRLVSIISCLMMGETDGWASSGKEDPEQGAELSAISRVNSAVSLGTPASLFTLPRVRAPFPLSPDEMKTLYLSHLKMFLPANFGLLLFGEAVQDMIFQKDSSFYHVIALLIGLSMAVGAEGRRGIRLSEFLDASATESRCSTGFLRPSLSPLYLQRLYILALPCLMQLVLSSDLGRSSNYILGCLGFVAFALTACEFTSLCHLQKPAPHR